MRFANRRQEINIQNILSKNAALKDAIAEVAKTDRNPAKWDLELIEGESYPNSIGLRYGKFPDAYMPKPGNWRGTSE